MLVLSSHLNCFAQTFKEYALDTNTIQLVTEPTAQGGQFYATDFSIVTKPLLAEAFADNCQIGVAGASIHAGATGVDTVFYGGDIPDENGYGNAAVPVYTLESFDRTNLPIRMSCQFYTDQDIPAYNESYLFFIPSKFKYFGSPTYYIDNQASLKEGVLIGGRPYQTWVQDTRSYADASRVLIDETHHITTAGRWYELSCVIDEFKGEIFVRNVSINGQQTYASAVNIGVLAYMNDFRIGFAADDLAHGFKILTNYRDVKADFEQNDTICVGECTSFKNTTEIENANIPTSYEWIFDGAEKNTTSEINPSNICYQTPGKFKVTLVSFNQFVRDTVSRWIVVKPFETVDLGKDKILCDGDSIELRVDISNVSYLWSTQDTTSTIRVFEPGEFWVRIARDECFSLDTVTVRLGDYLSLDLGPDTLVCHNANYVLNGFVAGGQSYSWNTDESTSSIVIKETGTYKVRVMGGCETVEDSVHIRVDGCEGVNVQVPTAFSPNDDGLNDGFKPVVTSNDCCQIQAYSFRVYNLWGELLFQSNDRSKAWDGKQLGDVVAQDIYIWTVDFKDVYQAKHFKGAIYVVR